MHITRKFWSPEFCGSYAPLNLKISRNILLKLLVRGTPLKLLNRISWNLVGSKGIICGCAYYQEILWGLCPFELKNFQKYTTIKYGIECVAVPVKSPQIFVINIYRPPDLPLKYFCDALNRLLKDDTWHSTNSRGRFQCGPFIQKRWCNHTYIFCFWTEYKILYYS